MEAAEKPTAVVKLPQLLKRLSEADADSSRDTIAEIRAVALLLDLNTGHGWKDLDGTAAIGMAESLRVACGHIEREYTRLYLANGIKF
jgi:hypothetical protein